MCDFVVDFIKVVSSIGQNKAPIRPLQVSNEYYYDNAGYDMLYIDGLLSF